MYSLAIKKYTLGDFTGLEHQIELEALYFVE